MGVTEAEREAFELLPDDERQCEACKTTCFLSAVTCSCHSSQLVCLRHFKDLCDCPPEKHTLRYRYTLDELPIMLQKLKLKAESFDSWVTKVKEAMDPKGDKIELNELKELLNEAETKKFPESELLTALTTAVQDAEKCASVAQQLLNNKQRTRTRQSVDTKYKLTIEELTLFYKEITNLCCELKESDGVKYILDQVLQFQKDAEQIESSDDDCDIEKLEKCIEFGDSICIELPALIRLKQKLSHMQWLDEVKSIQEEPKSATREDIVNLIEKGMSISPHCNVENKLSKLQALLINIDKWEDKAKSFLQSKNRQTMSAVDEFLREADDIDAYLPNLESLQDVLNKAKNWSKMVEEIQARDNFPYYDTLDDLVRKGRNIPLQLDALPVLESILSQAKLWKERTARTFLRKNSHYTLMEALSPRIGVGVQAMKAKKNKGEESIGAVVVCDTKLDDSNDSANVVAAFKLAEKREMEAMRNLRERNMTKTRLEDSRYCVCRKPRFGLMLQCELCKDWFHSTCVPLPKTANKNNKVPSSREMKFLCPCCLRSRRPRLETILALLVSLQKLSVRLPEGEALQCLTERAMNWQDRARQALSTEEICSALSKLSVLSQRLVEAAAREKTEKIISSELKKAANNPELHQRVQAIAPLSGVHSDDSATSAVDDDDDVITIDDEEPTCSTFTSNEHAYSYVSKFQPKSQYHNSDTNVSLSESARTRLEELMMEGDLLEVALDETQHIWQILSHTSRVNSVRKYSNFKEIQGNFNLDGKDGKKRGRKRKSDEFIEVRNPVGRPKLDEKTLLKRRSFTKDNKIPGQIKRGPRKMKRKEGEEGPKKRGVGNRKKTKQDTSDEEEDCAAINCLRPSGHEVDWVQCDGGCDAWFHMHCVGLDRMDIAEEDDYICSNCQDVEQTSTSRAPDQVAESLGLDALLSLSQSESYQDTDPEMDIQETRSFVRTC